MYQDIYNKINALSAKASELIARFGGLPDTDIVFRPTENFSDKEKSLPFKEPRYLGNNRMRSFYEEL